MIPDDRALRRIASIRARQGTRHPEVMNLLRRVRADVGPAGDPELDYIEALSLVNSGPAMLERGIDQLARLYQRRGQLPPELAREVALRYGYSLTQRARPADSELAKEVLSEVAPLVTTPAESDLLLAMRHMAHKIPEPEAPPPPVQTNGAPAETDASTTPAPAGASTEAPSSDSSTQAASPDASGASAAHATDAHPTATREQRASAGG
jgi:hypothetical protein